MLPCSSSRTSARTIERPVPVARVVDARALVRDREHDVAVSLRELDRHRARAVLERVLQQLAEDERERRRAVAGERHRLEPRLDTSRPPTRPCTSIARSRSISSAISTSSSRCSVSTSCTAAIARMRFTECSSASRGVDVVRARLQAQQRRDGLQVVLHAMVDLLREHAAHDGPAVLERNGRVVRDRLEQRAVVVGERRVAIGDELADLAALPAERRAHGVLARARPPATRSRPSSSTSAAPVACTASIVVFTIASSDSSR